MKRYVNELLYVVIFFNNLSTRVAAGEIPTAKEYTDFYNYCCYKKERTNNESIAVFPSLERKGLRNIIAANQRVNTLVENQTIQGRIRQFRLYLTWLFDKFHGEFNPPQEVVEKYRKLICKIKLDEEGLNHNSPKKTVSIDESSIPDDIFIALIEMILPSSPNNPFKSSKIRNYLIVNTFIQTGIRRGALAKMKISDCIFSGDYDSIKIYRGGTDHTDTRLETPNQKTKNHLIVVDTKLLQQYKVYIDIIRSGYSRSINHDFVFISEKNSKNTAGSPLSLKSINRIFSILSKALKFHIHPHTCRHKWNEIFDDSGRKSGMDSALIEDIRKYAMGWSTNSIMNQTYNEKKLHEKAREVHINRQKRIDAQ
ncbi:MAG: tyrosine-type recombinase/integrase [Pseudoalteromonas nigrifaciens]|uniref:tyrosine-type recombinase/integrase n=1 Tax=Pseudoalteromonas nigrifaciens TaxID=28109 RepID=UPI003F9D39D7